MWQWLMVQMCVPRHDQGQLIDYSNDEIMHSWVVVVWEMGSVWVGGSGKVV